MNWWLGNSEKACICSYLSGDVCVVYILSEKHKYHSVRTLPAYNGKIAEAGKIHTSTHEKVTHEDEKQ
jgi:hypothetical protein